MVKKCKVYRKRGDNPTILFWNRISHQKNLRKKIHTHDPSHDKSELAQWFGQFVSAMKVGHGVCSFAVSAESDARHAKRFNEQEELREVDELSGGGG